MKRDKTKYRKKKKKRRWIDLLKFLSKVHNNKLSYKNIKYTNINIQI